MRLFRTLLAVAVFGTAPLVAIQSVSAAPLAADHALSKIGTNTETVQYRHHGFRHHSGGWRHDGYGYNGRYGRYGGGYYRNGPAVLGGMAAGAIIGGAIANSHARVDSDGYCSQRYKSYDPASGTYLGYDGRRHSCP
jgi:hypothetical protein